jgi:hypothetical protein
MVMISSNRLSLLNVLLYISCIVKCIIKDADGHLKLLEPLNDWRLTVQETELLTAGFPCVDLSRAGLRKGLSGQVRDERGGLIACALSVLSEKHWQYIKIMMPSFLLIHSTYSRAII